MLKFGIGVNKNGVAGVSDGKGCIGVERALEEVDGVASLNSGEVGICCGKEVARDDILDIAPF